MRRRAVIAAVATAAAGRAGAQERVRRVGVVRWDTEAQAPETQRQLRRRLAELGWVEGRNLALEFGWADGDRARAEALVAAMIRNGAEVIVASSTPSVRAAIAVTRSVPIVMAPAVDPIGNGFVASLARPGGNVTGMTIGGSEIAAKQVELLREAVPGLARIGFLGAARDPAAPLFAAEIRAAAATLGLAVEVAMVDDMARIADAVASLASGGAQALVVQPLFVFQRDEVAALALRHRLPTISELRPLGEAGLLLIYGTSNAWQLGAAAEYVDRILRGARPADLPVERPTRIELAINLRTARALGLALPQAPLQRADEVIE